VTAAEAIAFGFRTSIFLSVLAVGLGATAADALYLVRRPMLLARALFAMHVIMLAFALIWTGLFELNPAIEIALLALALSPVPPFMPTLALGVGREERYTIGLMTALSVLSMAIVPSVLYVLRTFFDVPLGISPLAVAWVVLTTVLLPLVLGIAVSATAPRIAGRLVRPLAVLGNALLALAALPILVLQAPTMLELVGDGTLVSLAAFIAFGFAVGGALGGPEPDDRVVLALSTALRHPAVAIAITHRNFPGEPSVLSAVLLFLIMSAVSGAFFVRKSRRHRAQLA
jgi:BASS family bile acid:Na+ symporter